VTKVERRILGHRPRTSIILFLGEHGIPSSRDNIMKAVGFVGRQSSGLGRNLAVMKRRGFVGSDANMNYFLTPKGVRAYEKLKQEVPF